MSGEAMAWSSLVLVVGQPHEEEELLRWVC